MTYGLMYLFSFSRKSSRHWLLCPVCMKTQESLSCHLRRSCLKESEESDREEVVEKAKSDVLDLLKTGRAFSYKVLSRIVSSSNPLERLLVELKSHHLFVTGEPTPSPQGIPRLVAETGEPSGEAGSSDVESASSGELFQCNRETAYKARTSLKKANEMGILEKHSIDHPLLQGFAEHLRVNLENTKYKQQVETVSRYLYYADPVEPSLKFVRDREKLLSYTRKQSEANYMAQTSVKYLKCLKRLVLLFYYDVNSLHYTHKYLLLHVHNLT